MNKKQVTLVLAAMVIATGMATAATFNFPGMANLSDFIDDMVAIIPKIIPLVVVGAIILIVKNFGKMMEGLLKWTGLR